MEIIFPLIGVVIGWLLNEISSFLKLRSDDAKAFSGIMMDLFRMRSYLNCVILNSHRAAEYANKLNFDISEMEKRRRRNNELIIENIDEIERSLKSGLNKMACIDPVTAYEISSLLEGLTKLEIIKLDNVSKDRILYVDLIFQIEGMLEALLKKIDKMIIKLSKKVGIINYFKIKKFINKISKSNELSFIDYLDADLRKEYLDYCKNSKIKFDEYFSFGRAIDRLQKNASRVADSHPDDSMTDNL